MFPCWPLLSLPKVVPDRAVVERMLALMTRPYDYNFIFMMGVIRSYNEHVFCLIVSCTEPFFMPSTWKMSKFITSDFSFLNSSL